MAVQWMEDFKSYGTDVSLMGDGLYVQAAGLLQEDPDPNTTGIVMHLNDGLTSGLRKVLSSNQTKVGVAQRFWFLEFPNSANIPYFIRFNDEDNVTNVSLAITSTGALQVYRGNGVALLGATSGPVVVTNAWTHIECIVTGFSDTTGAIDVYVNGVHVLALTNKDTLNGKTHCAQIVHSVNNGFDGLTRANLYIKDLFIYDGSGTRNNSVAGTVSVTNIVETSDTTLGDWLTSSGSTGFNLINESPPVDSSYISADDAATDPAVMGNSDLPEDVTTVRALMTLVRARKVDGGDGNLQVGLISDGETDLGAAHPLTTAFTYYYDFSEEDPATDDPWTPDAVNAVEIQFDRTL